MWQKTNGTLPEKGNKMTLKMWSQMTDAEKAEFDKNNPYSPSYK